MRKHNNQPHDSPDESEPMATPDDLAELRERYDEAAELNAMIAKLTASIDALIEKANGKVLAGADRVKAHDLMFDLDLLVERRDVLMAGPKKTVRQRLGGLASSIFRR